MEHLAADLRHLGVEAGDFLMVHASLRAIGQVDGGADGVLEALQHAIGPRGTLLMTLGARDGHAWVNERPEAERPALLEGSEPFDAATTPSDPDVGVLAEVFRCREGTVVSEHPEGRFGAWGRLARELTAKVPWNDYYGAGSPLERFVEAGGRVLRLEPDPNTTTVLHYAEYCAAVPSKRRVRRHRLVLGPDGPVVRVVEALDDSDGIVDYPGDDYFSTILREYLAAGRAATGVVGHAASELIEAGDLVDFAVAWMNRNLTGGD